jgi:hypothetical protein
MGSVYPEYLISELERGEPGPLTERSRFLFLGGTGDRQRELIARYPEKLGYIAASDVLKPSNEWFDKALTTTAVVLTGSAVVKAVLPVLGNAPAAAEFVGPPESIAGVGQAASFVGPPTSIAGVGGLGIGGAGDVAAAAMENQVMTSGGILGTIGGVAKVIGGGIDTLATVIPKVDTIYRTIEGVLGKEDQPTVHIADNPAGDLPASSAPVINLTIPPQSTGGIVLTTPAAGQPNVMLYAGLAILAIILFKGL